MMNAKSKFRKEGVDMAFPPRIGRSFVCWGILLVINCSCVANQSIRFEDVAAAAGLTLEGSGGSGIAIGDYNRDGLLDVLFVGDANRGPQLYRNNGVGTFTNVTASVLPSDIPNGTTALFVDLNNDGYQDIAMARWYGDSCNIGFSYLINHGGAYFENGILSENIGRAPMCAGGIAACDVDSDGYLDIVLVHKDGPGVYLHNLGGMGFADETPLFGAGLGNTRVSWSCVFADFNNDHLSDMHVAIDGAADYQCRNLGNGTFKDVSREAGVGNVGSDMGLAVGDIDNDGDLDIFSTNISIQVLYINNGHGVFKNEAASRGVKDNKGGLDVGWGTVFGDFDHDGDLDLIFVAISSPGSVYENNALGYFTDVTDMSGVKTMGLSMAAFDYDNDGALDLLITGVDDVPKLYHNVSPALIESHWLGVSLDGNISNRQGVGARVEVTAGQNRMIRELMAGDSFWTGNPQIANFGLDSATFANTVKVYWPSGIVQTIRDVPADQYITIVEPMNPDLTGDKVVDMKDINQVFLSFECDDGGDVNGDGITDLVDLDLLLQVYGSILR